MIEAKMPKDIRVYETKLIGPLTLRQTICLYTAEDCRSMVRIPWKFA